MSIADCHDDLPTTNAKLECTGGKYRVYVGIYAQNAIDQIRQNATYTKMLTK